VRRFALVFGVAALASCGRPETPAPARPDYTPAKTLYTLKLAYNAPDYRTYEALFSPDGFLLEAEAPPAGMPRPWRFREEMEATRALFREAYHVVLEMDATEETVGAPPAGATELATDPVDVRVRVWREPTFCFYARGKVAFALKRLDASAPWLIVGLADGTAASRADVVANEQTLPCSWTEIKYYYLTRSREENAGH
jgi:hypothetical protein